ncbi:hypothetical protein CKAH01_15054 [Colletotrichum kahawae]|uniref:Uncharacterized protein n=1 Tax=Colletotrichum kahawae TaxID=34407 RepID=A0AAD9YLU6_COLKA|nr:hypothetical protein CKAH01_15054 [Colletotrichum kahawae]
MERPTVSSPERNGVIRTHDIVYTRAGLQGLAEEFKKTLLPDGQPPDSDSTTQIYGFQWLGEYVGMVRRYLDFDDKTAIDYLAANDGRESNDIGHCIKAKLARSGFRSPRESGRYLPSLSELRSGCQWVPPGKVAIIFLIDTPHSGAVNVDILYRNEAGHEQIETSMNIKMGSVIQVYGPSGWKASCSVSFLHLSYDIERV